MARFWMFLDLQTFRSTSFPEGTFRRFFPEVGFFVTYGIKVNLCRYGADAVRICPVRFWTFVHLLWISSPPETYSRRQKIAALFVFLRAVVIGRQSNYDGSHGEMNCLQMGAVVLR